MLLFFSIWIKCFFVLTPPFGLTMFLSMTQGFDERKRKKLALTITAAVAILCLILFFAGRQIFSLLGITLDSFRIGAGALLFLSGINLIHGKSNTSPPAEDSDIAVVPLATPIIVGPATMGTLLVMGVELESIAAKGTGCLALLFAVLCTGGVLFAGSFIERLLKARGINVLSKLTGLVLSALAAQMVMTGILGFMGVQQ